MQLACALLPALAVLYVQAAHAQVEFEEPGTEETPRFSLHVPPMMIAGSEYEAMILLGTPRAENYTVNLASDSRYVDIPPSVIIPAGQNHALFQASPRIPYGGPATIHAVTAEYSASAGTEVFSISENPTSILLAAPGVDPQDGSAVLRTSSQEVPMKVILANSHGIPAVADADVQVTLTSSAGTEFSTSNSGFVGQHDVTIQAGRFGADVTARVFGDGTIYAVSDSLRAADLDVRYLPEETGLRIAVTPVPAAADSAARFLVWMESGGRVFLPAGPVDVTLTSGSGHLVFRPGDFGQGDGSQAHVRISPKTGMAGGVLYVGSPPPGGEPASITAVSDAVASATASVSIAEPAQDSADVICLWVNPPVPAGTGWITAGLYSLVSNETDAGETDVCHTDHDDVDDPKIRPVRLSDGGLDEIEITGLVQHGSEISLLEVSGGTADLPVLYHRSSVDREFEVMDHGPQTVSVGSEGPVHGNSITFETSAPYGSENRMTLSGIPTRPGVDGDIAFVYVENPLLSSIAEGAIDTDSVIVTQFGDSVTGMEVGPTWTGGASTVRGTYTGGSPIVLTGVAAGVMSAGALEYSVFGTGDGLDVWMPDTVNTGSEFPVVFHMVDSAGVPIARAGADAVRISAGGMSVHDSPAGHVRGIVPADGPGRISVISDDRHIAEFEFEGFSNPAGGVGAVSRSPDVVQLGGQILMELLTGSLTDPDVSILSDLDFALNPETGLYEAEPDEPGIYTATIVIDKDGWDRYAEDITWSVEHMVDVTFQTVTDDGVGLSLEMGLTSAGGEETAVPQGVYKSAQVGINTVTMPLEHSFGEDRTYFLKEAKANGVRLPLLGTSTVEITEDTVFTAIYQREITVEFEPFIDAESGVARAAQILGNGMYRYGDTVSLRAPPVPEWFGLVWHVPVRWVTDDVDSGRDGAGLRFEALRPVSGYVEYERSYTALIVLVAAGTAVPLLLIRARSPETILDIRDAIVGMRRRMRGTKGGGSRTRRRLLPFGGPKQ